ncbi:hypothetical protein CNMCM5793_005611 [Aspergillus hiratsukae]|uniref:Uncharacterized protein n=1 Tax=Aspergillus hiratsukae TaxID=1194566 RepID=A0A8H6PGA8_9EURO|nr:hypothetical protein CNMCM5793_005611 [Aspergillus hiratsukae]KAF7174021.1 hypothetical protein CNMCM6106_008133 [Aspergillus hiratsukae]
MSDPLSLPAGVAGIISLGLQVTQGIVSLCSAWKGYGGDMENLRNKTTGLANALTHLDHVLRQTSSGNAFTNQVVDLLDCSKVTMEKLDKLRAKLPTPAIDKHRGIKRKITYPFEKQTILEMRSMIDSLQGNIDTALNILHVHQGTRLMDDVATHTAVSLHIRDQLADHRVRLENLESMLRDVHNHGYMVAPSLLRFLHEDSQNLMDSNGPNSNNFGGQTSSTTVLRSRRGILQDVQRGKSRERLIVNGRFQIGSKLLQLSLTVSLAITKGAGGCSINPTIAYRSFRDFDKIGLLEILDTRELLPALKFETQWISNTLYGYVMFEHNSNMLHQAINYLVQQGVPMDIPTDWNQTALDCLLGPSRSNPPGSKPPVQHRLISDMVNAGCYITDNALNPWNRALIQYIVLYYPEAARVSYPALVILQKAERELVSLVGSGQLSGNHIIGNYTALQLATGWPAGIRILLDAGADMTRSGTGNAMDPYNGWCCNPLRWVIPSDCPASLLVFLRAGAALQPAHIGYAVIHSTPEMVDILVEELIRRRQRLRELAFTALPTHIRHTLHLSHDVLPDANAPMIFDALRDAGISVSTSMDPRGWHKGNVGPEYGTIFHQGQLDRQLMDRLYAAGFVDVDALNSAGYSPLMIIASDRLPHVVIERANWLVDKGADMTRCLPGISIPIIHVMTNYATWNLEEQARLHWEYPEATESSSSFTPDLETIVFFEQGLHNEFALCLQLFLFARRRMYTIVNRR